MKQILLMIAVVALVGCGKKDDGNTGVVNPNKPSPKAVPVNIADPIVEKAIRKKIKKRSGELTKADYEKVETLYLSGNQLTNVKGLEKLTQLTELDLSLNKLTDVKGLEKLTKLKTLDLGGNKLTVVSNGLENLTQLRQLGLSDNKLTDVKGLEKLTQLRYLNLLNNPDLTKAQIAELQKALPNCDIYSNPKK